VNLGCTLFARILHLGRFGVGFGRFLCLVLTGFVGFHGHDMLHFLGAAVGLGLIFGLEVATQVMAQDAPRLEARPADTDAPEVPRRL
jgi:hypothetical protein